MTLNGTKMNYYFICKRKLWLFSHGVTMEHESEAVAMGRVVSDTTYKERKHEIRIDDISLDFADIKSQVIHEIKLSDKMETAHQWQVKYYLWVLKSKGLGDFTAMIDYPKLKQRLEVVLTLEDEVKLSELKTDIEDIVARPHPPERIEKKFCKKCAYFELCWV